MADTADVSFEAKNEGSGPWRQPRGPLTQQASPGIEKTVSLRQRGWCRLQ